MDSYFNDARLHAAFWDASPVPHAIVSTKGTFLRVNEAWAKLLGYSRSELIGNHFRTITHPADIDADQSEVSRLLTDPDAHGYSMVKRYLSKQGTAVWVELHVVAIRDAESTLESFAVVVVPLPVASDRHTPASNGVITRLVDCYINLVSTRPRECLIALVSGLVAINAIPFGVLIELVKAYFNP